MPVYVQDKLQPRGTGEFALLDAKYVLVGYDKNNNNAEIRLSEKLEQLGSGGGNAGGGNVNVDDTLSIPGWAADAAKVGERLDAIDKAVIEDTTDGSGYVRNIQTFDGDRILRLFIGTEEEYAALLPEEKEDLLAIITNGATDAEIMEAISQLRTDVDEMLGRELYKSVDLKLTAEGLYIVELLYIEPESGEKQFLGSGILRYDKRVTHSCVLNLETIVEVSPNGTLTVYDKSDGSYDLKDMTDCEIHVQQIGVV